MKDSHFYIQNEESWLRIPETNRSIPIPEGLHLMVLKFAAMQHIPIDSYLFYDNNGKKYTYQSFRKAIMGQCPQYQTSISDIQKSFIQIKCSKQEESKKVNVN